MDKTLIKNAKIYDGSGAPAFFGDVLIEGERIVQIAASIPMEDEFKAVDLLGLSLAPGFIDAHSHNDWFALRKDALKYFAPFIKQGITTFSTKNENADVYGYNIRKDGDEIRFSVRTKDFDRAFKLSIPGFFNVDNALAAISVLSLLNVPYECMYEGIAHTSVEGRMELHRSRDGKYNAIVDFAHNTMSYEALAKNAKKEFPNKKIVFIFGCPGNKAFNRRHDLADAAGRHSDFIYITEDDTASESFESISLQVAKNVEATGCPYKIIEDRETAIRTALDEMGEESVLLIAGKGNETNQRVANGYKDYITDAGAVEKYYSEYYVANAVIKN